MTSVVRISEGRGGRFDFRIAARERERAVRMLEGLLRRSATSGEEPDSRSVSELQAVITGQKRGFPIHRPRWKADEEPILPCTIGFMRN